MDTAAVLARYDREMREGARPDGPGARVERSAGVVRQVAPAHGWNGVLWSGLDADTDVDAVIAEQIARYAALGHAFEWKLYGHDRPAGLGDRLRAAGFVPEGEETLLVAETAMVSLDAGPPTGVHIRAVGDAAGVDLVVEVHERAFGTDGSRLRRDLLERLAADPDSLVAVVALAGDAPVSAARMELVPGTSFAGLWGGGTVAGWRGRGLYRALVAHRARVAADRGFPFLQADATSQSRPILRRLGFVPLTTTTPFVYGG
ncbi:MAG: GNAT family N-acetyltransferase [Streptomyces sp.]|nr:GNAT family N-acetyltransferase [Streptomyces sp.]